MSSADSQLLAAAGSLAGAPVRKLEQRAFGGNNRVFRLDTAVRTYALKVYHRTPSDARDRLGAEFAGLRYAARVAPGRVPEAIAFDAVAGMALYEWIEGGPVGPRCGSEVDEVLNFIAALHGGRTHSAAANIPHASEAILEPEDLTHQIERRLRALQSVPDEPGLAALLRTRLEPLFFRLKGALTAIQGPPIAERTLSPSDFGFHNALRRGGSLVFVDFEYFGWDDPVKLVCDFLWHPGMDLTAAEADRFLEGATALYGSEGSFAARLAAYEPLIGLRWAAIVLGEFLPEVRSRRRYAGRDPGGRDVLEAQLAKAEALIARVEARP